MPFVSVLFPTVLSCTAQNGLPQIFFIIPCICSPCICLSPHLARYMNNTVFHNLNSRPHLVTPFHTTPNCPFFLIPQHFYRLPIVQALIHHRISFSSCFSQLHHFSQPDYELLKASTTSTCWIESPTPSPAPWPVTNVEENPERISIFIDLLV